MVTPKDVELLTVSDDPDEIADPHRRGAAPPAADLPITGALTWHARPITTVSHLPSNRSLPERCCRRHHACCEAFRRRQAVGGDRADIHRRPVRRFTGFDRWPRLRTRDHHISADGDLDHSAAAP